MLEALVSSKIRRALLEHILTHPADRFYLRGLAKQLGLAVSPLRRELKRLEHSGMLTSAPEANSLFYSVNIGSPAFLELKGMQPAAAPVVTPAAAPVVAAATPMMAAEVELPKARSWQAPLRGPVLAGVAVTGLVLMLLVTSVSYLSLTNHRLVSSQAPKPPIRKAEVTIVVPPAPAMMMSGPGQSSASGAMRGGRWHVVPGGFGGFSSGSKATQESY